VTGASSGIGAAIAKALAAAGAGIAVNYRSGEEAAEAVVAAIRADGGEAFAIQADVSREEEVERMVAETVRRFGTLHVLVANAGVQKDGAAQMFPDAEIIVPAAELKWWTQPADSIPQPRRGNAQLVQSTLATWKNVKPVDGEADVAPGIRAIPAFGHTQGHTAHLISSGGKQLLATADATNIYSLFAKHPDWQAAFDHVPDLAVETRKKLFDRAIAEKWMVAGYHWGLPNVGTISKDGSGYAFTAA